MVSLPLPSYYRFWELLIAIGIRFKKTITKCTLQQIGGFQIFYKFYLSFFEFFILISNYTDWLEIWQEVLWAYLAISLNLLPIYKISINSKHVLTELILVWFANIRPETLWADWIYGDFLERATCILAGPHGINCANFRSLILCSDLWTWVGSTSPWMKK